MRESLNQVLLRNPMPTSEGEREKQRFRLGERLEAADLDGVEELLRSAFADIPHQRHAGVEVARYETWFASVFYSCFLGSGLDVRVEDATSRGRIDMTAVTSGNVYVFEFKVLGSAAEGTALRQLHDKGYTDKYKGQGRTVRLVGVEFDPDKRNVAAFETERA